MSIITQFSDASDVEFMRSGGGTMSATLTRPVPGALAIDVKTAITLVVEMNANEQGIALAASDMPTSVPFMKVSLEQAALWVVQGVERLGGEVACWWAACQDCQRDRGTESGPVYREREQRTWGGRRRGDKARALAFGLYRNLQAAGYRRSNAITHVELPWNEFGERWAMPIPTRELEMARRHAENCATR